MNLDDPKTAEIVYNSLIVDKEPPRSKSIKSLRVDGHFIVA